MRARIVAAAPAFLLAAACATPRAPSPPPPAPAREAHFAAEDGSPLPAYEPVWDLLRSFYGAAMPARVTVATVDGSGGRFETDRSRVVLGRDELAVSGPALVAHEASHLCLSVLTGGASATEPFRFLDEGFASILEARAARREAEHAEEALAVAALELRAGRAGIDRLQRWSEYFGDWRGGGGGSRNFDAYRVGASFELWLLRRHGERRLRDLFVAVGRTRSLDAALVEVLGAPASQVEAEWKAYLASATIPDDTPSVVELVPADGAADVAPDRTEITARFSVPMNRSIVNLGADCSAGICYTNATWTSATVLTVRLPAGLRPGTTYSVKLGVEGHALRSRYGRELPVTTWRFTTR